MHIILIVYAMLTTMPLLLVLAISLTDERVLALNGYSFFPEKLSVEAYQFIFAEGGTILKAYGITIFVTVAGTALGLLVTSMYAYAMSRKDFKYNRFFTLYAVITLLFNGGLVPWYLICSQLLNLKDNIWALIVPDLANAY